MNLPESISHKNGQSPASSDLGEAAVFVNHPTDDPLPSDAAGVYSQPQSIGSDAQSAQKSSAKPAPSPTVFPSDVPSPSIRTFFYGITHGYVAGSTLFRWLLLILSAFFVISLVTMPAFWIAILVIWAGFLLAISLWRRQLQNADFVRFEEESLPATHAQAAPPTVLQPADKIPVHVTGQFAVESREARFTWISGFYRTFATREHALLCQIQDKRVLGLARLDDEKIGMWYIFFHPEDIIELRLGKVFFGSTPSPAIAATRRVEGKAKKRFGREKIVHETFFMAFKDESTRHQVWMDLHVDLQ